MTIICCPGGGGGGGDILDQDVYHYEIWSKASMHSVVFQQKVLNNEHKRGGGGDI